MISKRLLLVFVCFVVLIVVAGVYGYVGAQDTDADGMVITPRVDTTGVQLNETAYRLHGGDTLNFTFEFSTKGTGAASLPINFTVSADINYTGIARSYWKEFKYVDGFEAGYFHHLFLATTVEGSVGHSTAGGRANENSTSYIFSGGNHVINYVFLFTIEGAAQGYADINFLSEVMLTVVESDLPFLIPPQLVAVSTATGGAVTAGIIGAALFIKKRRSKPVSAESPSIEKVTVFYSI